MEMQKQKNSNPNYSTQKYINVAEIKENTLIIKDGSLRAVIAVSSTNFALKSEDEQNALISAYQGLLNSLDFPLQILVHSRVLDIEGYLAKLKGLASGQTNELLRIQMTEYIEYIGRLVEFANIMSKNFYVVVPYSAVAVKQTMGSKIKKFFNPVAQIATNQEDFHRAKTKLDERVNHVMSELGSVGLRSLVLTTEELVELLYQSYNLDAASPLHAENLQGLEIQE